MPWLDEFKPCEHANRPTPQFREHGRVWECGSCGARWQVVGIDYGHDVMPGESPVGARWQEVDRGR